MKEDRSFSRNRTVLRDKLRKKIVLPLFLLQMLCSFTQVCPGGTTKFKAGKFHFTGRFEKDRNSYRNGIFL